MSFSEWEELLEKNILISQLEITFNDHRRQIFVRRTQMQDVGYQLRLLGHNVRKVGGHVQLNTEKTSSKSIFTQDNKILNAPALVLELDFIALEIIKTQKDPQVSYEGRNLLDGPIIMIILIIRRIPN